MMVFTVVKEVIKLRVQAGLNDKWERQFISFAEPKDDGGGDWSDRERITDYNLRL